MFVKELKMYIDYLKNKIEEYQISTTNKQKQYLLKFVNNLDTGISYYQKLFSGPSFGSKILEVSVLGELEDGHRSVCLLNDEIEKLPILKK